MSNLEHHAETELRLAGLFDEDSDYGGMIGPAVMKMVKEFAAEGHSGYSALLALQVFDRVARFEPLSPLTGEDHEWVEVGEGMFQNRRCSHVFKNADGAYDIDGPDGRTPVTFPYVPAV